MVDKSAVTTKSDAVDNAKSYEYALHEVDTDVKGEKSHGKDVEDVHVSVPSGLHALNAKIEGRISTFEPRRRS